MDENLTDIELLELLEERGYYAKERNTIDKVYELYYDLCDKKNNEDLILNKFFQKVIGKTL